MESESPQDNTEHEAGESSEVPLMFLAGDAAADSGVPSDPDARPDPPAIPSAPPAPRWAPILTGVLAVAFLMVSRQLFSTLVLNLHLDMTPELYRAITAAGQLLMILPIALIVARIQSRTQQAGIPRMLRLRRARPQAFFAAAVGVPLIYGVAQLYLVLQEFYLIPESWMGRYLMAQKQTLFWQSYLLQNSGPVDIVEILLVMAVMPGICEEIFFRGIVQQNFERSMRPAYAIVLASILFSTVHLQPHNFVALAMVGGFLGYLFWRTGSIFPGMVAHALFNGTMVAVAFLLPRALVARRHTNDELMVCIEIGLIALGLLIILFAWLNRVYTRNESAALQS